MKTQQDGVLPPEEAIASFHNWQGSVTWVEGKREQSFRSVLELILLIDSALREDGKSE